ncbi:MAG TPA: hypothetical protein ENK49_04105 [Gammaproteobacteria bacterium]|nr:hypothetical protein [Gammaproteobacteria bacterium]
MTGLLASVANTREATVAIAGGADIIDLKEPASGALGAVSPATQKAVVRLVAKRRLVSATVGNLPMEAKILSRAIESTARTGVDIIKVGLPHLEQHRHCLKALSGGAEYGVRIVAVLFAEHRPYLHLLDELADAGCFGVMLDTADKSAGSLCSFIDRSSLAIFVRYARGLGLSSGLAGSLTTEDIVPLLALDPDYLGFRGTLCEAGTRTAELSPQALARVRERFNNAGNTSRRAV